VLQHSPRDFDDRHRSLKSAVTWSYNLLNQPQRTVYRSLGVFRGGFSRQAVAGIAGEQDSPDSASIDRILRELGRHNLVRERPDPGSDRRFTMFEAIRADALERCLQAGELHSLHDRHAQWYLGRMAEIDWLGARLEDGLAQARADQDNVRAALSWLIALGEAQKALHLCTALRRFWEYDGYQSEGQSWLAQALALPQPAPPLLRAQALLDGCVLAFQQGNYATAQTWGEESLSLFTAAGQVTDCALVVLTLGRIAIEQGQYAVAQAWEEQALAVYRSIDDSYGVAGALTHLAEIALGRGDDHAAQQWAEASLALTADLGGVFWEALTHGTLTEVALRAGRIDQTRWHVLQSLEIGMSHYAIRQVTLTLALAAAVVCQLPGSKEERSWQAARLWGAVTGLRQARGLSFSHGHKQRLDSYLVGARAELGPEAWRHTEQQSSRLSLEATVAQAREMLDSVNGGQEV
jgi:non-specific serine/threonine protein kinase